MCPTSSPSRFNRGAVTKAKLRVRSCLGLLMLCRMTVSPERTLLTLASRSDMVGGWMADRAVLRGKLSATVFTRARKIKWGMH